MKLYSWGSQSFIIDVAVISGGMSLLEFLVEKIKKTKKQKLKETPNFHHRYCPLCILQQIILPDLFTLVHLNYLSRLAILTTLMKSNHSSLGGGLLMLVG